MKVVYHEIPIEELEIEDLDEEEELEEGTILVPCESGYIVLKENY
tara:strand:- start:267 stop:401 length:135 start_codon:yes stop_codon:yes gene_type:complete